MRTRNEKKENAIRDRAMEMIVNEGFDGLSMQKLARAAGVSPATIYIYYKNREDLLNSLYNEVNDTFAEVALRGFDPQMSLEKGLWLQWQNRLHFILEYPVYFKFFEQFRNSPLIMSDKVRTNAFREAMCRFVQNAVAKGEMPDMEPELFWSIAYGSFYSIIKFHLQEKSMMNSHFKISEERLRKLHAMVIAALKPAGKA